MNQREKISNNFSDTFLLAMLEGRDTQDVLAGFSKEFPELVSQFEANADSLNLMYGNIRSEAKPSDEEIAAAYKKVSERFAPTMAPAKISTEPGFFSRMKSIFSTSPTWAGASLGIGVAVIIALLWQPWVIKESLKESEQSTAKKEQQTTSKPQEFASAEQQNSANPTAMPEVSYRGNHTKEHLSAVEKKRQDSIDESHMKSAAQKPLDAPHNLHITPLTNGSVIVQWDAAAGALSYIVEIRNANDATFDPVTQISQTRTKITQLESGKTYFVRVIGASGERKGPPSDVKSIVVP
jgi:hypothetical protein